MVTLFTYGPIYELKDLSPFVIKAHALLRMAKVEYKSDENGYNRAPKGKLPYVNDNGTVIADSTFIRWHLEKTRGIDLDAGHSMQERAIAWAFEKMCEDHLYWILLGSRWLEPYNFAKGPNVFFSRMPTPVRQVIKFVALKQISKALRAQGTGLHSKDERDRLGMRDLTAIADHLGDKPYFMGNQPTGVDASIYGFVSSVLCPEFKTPLRDYAETRPHLRAYCDRMENALFPKGH